MAVVGIDGNGRFPRPAPINARVGRKVGEHWRRLTSRVVEPSQPVGAKPRKPNKTGGAYRFLLPATVGILALATCDDDPLIAGPLEPGDLAAKEKHVALREVTVRVQATANIVPVVVLFSLAAVGATAAIIYKAKHK